MSKRQLSPQDRQNTWNGSHYRRRHVWQRVIRVIPQGLDIEIDFFSWTRPKIFDFIQSAGVEEEEMRKAFNLGIGYVLIIDKNDLEEVTEALAATGETPVIIGSVKKCLSCA